VDSPRGELEPNPSPNPLPSWSLYLKQAARHAICTLHILAPPTSHVPAEALAQPSPPTSPLPSPSPQVYQPNQTYPCWAEAPGSTHVFLSITRPGGVRSIAAIEVLRVVCAVITVAAVIGILLAQASLITTTESKPYLSTTHPQPSP
jgi:hypothetical protein